MKSLKTIFALFFVLGVSAIMTYFFSSSSEKIPHEQKYTKEYFFEQQMKLQRNPLQKAIRSTLDQAASTFSLYDEKILLPIEFKMQENPLTCEIAALRMSLNYLGVKVTETDLLYEMSFSTKDPRSPENIWGDPQKGFVGTVDGSVFLGTGYGVYNQPIKELASKYRDAATLKTSDVTEILKQVKEGKPVIVWGLLSDKNPTYWLSHEGEAVEAFPGEHARVVIGYTGSIESPSNIILMDPLFGKIKINTEKFVAEWEKMDFMSVVIS